MNAEIDATIGPILQVYAERHGVIMSACDGDEPGVQMNLFRWVKGLGLEPRVIGNVKGLQDPYRNPTTQKGFAEQWGQAPSMVTSFADGSKISLRAGDRRERDGIHGPAARHVTRSRVPRRRRCRSASSTTSTSSVSSAASSTTWSGRLTRRSTASQSTPIRSSATIWISTRWATGPLYSFFIPYHLVHFEVPFAIARVVLLRDARRAAAAGPCVEVCAVAKRDLKAGETLDDYGMYMTYGEAVDARRWAAHRYLPEGLGGLHAAARHRAGRGDRRYATSSCPKGRLADRLRAEQLEHFRGESWLSELLDGKHSEPASASR